MTQAHDPSAVDRLADELRALAAWHMSRQRASHTLQPTALVNEAYLKLVGSGRWTSDEHFLALASVAMRQVLVDHARRHRSQRRGGDRPRELRMSLDDVASRGGEAGVLEIDDLLKRLSESSARHAQVAQLKLFGGMTHEQISRAIGVSRATAAEDWGRARTWLAERLVGET